MMHRTRALRQTGVSSKDPVEISSYLSRLYGADMRLELLNHRHGERVGLDHSRFDGGGFSLEDIRHDGDVETRGEVTSGVVVLFPTEGRADSHVDGHEGFAGAGEMVLGSTAAAPIRVRTRDVAMNTVVIERRLLNKAAADLVSQPPAFVRFTGLGPVTPEAARVLTATRRYVEETLLTDDGAAAPLVLAAAGRLLAAAVFSTFPNTAGEVEGPQDRNDHPVLLRRAVAYIEEHVAEDIGVADVASAVYVTPRALQYIFRRHLDSTPMAYLRRVRLDHVHRDLVAGDRASTTVTATAARWGFAHVGRFAVLYRETYGQSPHVTLRC
jgi:AraC-like DNA-binding protein